MLQSRWPILYNGNQEKLLMENDSRESTWHGLISQAVVVGVMLAGSGVGRAEPEEAVKPAVSAARVVPARVLGGDPACGAGAGDCFVANGTPGCDDVACCNTVCGLDPFCCANNWDQFCANRAVDECGGGDPTGACCIFESCRDLTEADCTASGGVFQALVDCVAANCAGGATPSRSGTDSRP
jgi:hypothetical protein